MPVKLCLYWEVLVTSGELTLKEGTLRMRLWPKQQCRESWHSAVTWRQQPPCTLLNPEPCWTCTAWWHFDSAGSTAPCMWCSF